MAAPSNTLFPIIDISRIDDVGSHLELAKEITQGCRQWGFLLLKGHPIPTADIEDMFCLGKEFFTLPDGEKDSYPITSKSIGYVGSFKDRGKDDKMSMWFGGVPGALEDNKDTIPPFWHLHAQKIEDFKHKCHSLIIQLLECFATALQLPDREFFSNAHREDTGDGNSLRMILYPARSEMPSFEGLGSRMAEHTDSGSVTLLFQRAPGLEVLSPAGEWVQAPHIEDCILVNLGDTLAFWSGRQLKATLHRVTFDSLAHTKERQTMAYFGKASPETVLQPIKPDKSEKKYYTNGVELRPGMTVDELSTTIMRNIYGAAFQSTEKSREQADLSTASQRTTVA